MQIRLHDVFRHSAGCAVGVGIGEELRQLLQALRLPPPHCSAPRRRSPATRLPLPTSRIRSTPVAEWRDAAGVGRHGLSMEVSLLG